MPWPPRIVPTACGFAAWMAAMSRPSWKPGRRHGTQTTRSPKISLVSCSPSGRGDGDAAVGVQVVDVGGVDQAVHRGVDRRSRTALAVQAEVEGGDHLVLAVDARIDVDEARIRSRRRTARPDSVRVPRSPPEPLTHSSSTCSPGDRVGLGALGRGVAAGVVRVPGVGPEAVRSGEQLGNGSVGHVGLPGFRVSGVHGVAALGWLVEGRRSGAPAGLGAADALGDDLVLRSRWRHTPPSGPRAGPGRRASRRGRRGRRCRTRPSGRRCRRARHRPARPRRGPARSTSSARAVISWTLSTERIWPGILSSMLWHWSSMKAMSLPSP